MLNELLEFKAYVTDPESETPRVQPYLLTDYFDESANLIGIEHIMTMIARAFIFSDKKTVLDEVISQEVVDDTIELLHRWTGFEEDKKIEGSLRPQMLSEYIGQEKAKENLKVYIVKIALLLKKLAVKIELLMLPYTMKL